MVGALHLVEMKLNLLTMQTCNDRPQFKSNRASVNFTIKHSGSGFKRKFQLPHGDMYKLNLVFKKGKSTTSYTISGTTRM